MKSKRLYFTDIGLIGENKWSMNLKFFPFRKKHLLIEGDFAKILDSFHYGFGGFCSRPIYVDFLYGNDVKDMLKYDCLIYERTTRSFTQGAIYSITDYNNNDIKDVLFLTNFDGLLNIDNFRFHLIFLFIFGYYPKYVAFNFN